MPPRIDDRWLWLGFGIFLFFAAKNIRHAIKDTVRLTEIDPAQYEDKDEKCKQQPEDSIDLAALKTLANSPNSNIANAAISLIVTRFAQTPGLSQVLAEESYSKDETLRRQARTAVRFLKEWPLPPDADRESAFELPWIPASRDRPENGWGEDSSPWTPDSLPEIIDGTEVGEDDPGLRRAMANWSRRPGSRVPYDAVEVERRRRRREAMVLHEGSGGIEESDIIRPR